MYKSISDNYQPAYIYDPNDPMFNPWFRPGMTAQQFQQYLDSLNQSRDKDNDGYDDKTGTYLGNGPKTEEEWTDEQEQEMFQEWLKNHPGENPDPGWFHESWKKFSDFLGGFGSYGKLADKGMDYLQKMYDWFANQQAQGDPSSAYDPSAIGMVYDMLYGTHGIGHPEFRDKFLNDLPSFYGQYTGAGGEMSFKDWYDQIIGGISRDYEGAGGGTRPGAGGTGSENGDNSGGSTGGGGGSGGGGGFPDWSGMQKPGLIDPYGGKSTADFWGPQMGGAFPTMNWWDVGYQSGPYENDMYFNPIDFGTPQGQGPVGGGGMPPDFMAMLMSMLGGQGGGR